mgnify:CR=1 FL=1
MRRKISGKTLLIDGPACIQLLSGKAEVLGAEIIPETKIIIRKGKRLPIEAHPEFEAELFLGEEASCIETDVSATPPSWWKTVNEILSKEGKTITLILGGVDSGKTGFCVYLANSALKTNRKVSIIDCDLGQSDLGPPGTIGLCHVQKPFTDLFTLFPDDSIFIGITNPHGAVNKVLEAVKRLKEKALRNEDLLIVNTDGWIDGDDAVKYKLKLVEIINPDYIVAARIADEMDPIISSLEKGNVFIVDVPENIKKRNRETRRLLRGFAYKKHLRGSKIRSFPLKRVKIEGSLNLNSERKSQIKAKIEEILRTEILCFDETADSIVLVIEKKAKINEEAVKVAETKLNKRLFVLREGDEKGLLVSLEDRFGKMLGIGVIQSVDFRKMNIKICTPVNERVSLIRVSKIQLDSEGNEKRILFQDLELPRGA